MKKHTCFAFIMTTVFITGLSAGCGRQGASPAPEGMTQTSAAQKNETEVNPNSEQNNEQTFEGQTLSIMVAKSDSDSAAVNAVIAAFEEKYAVNVELEEIPGADEGENIIKLRMATNSLPDVLNMSVGAKLRELDPANTLIDLSNEEFLEHVDDGYLDAATVDGKVYAVPIPSTSNVAGIYYNKKVYEKLGLGIPETWDAFLQNCAKLKEGGIDPVAAPYESTGLSQIPFLANYYYVQNEIPAFAEDYTANKITLSESDVFVQGLQKMHDLAEYKYLNEDYLSTSNDVACQMLAEGTAAHMIIRSNILSTIDALYPECTNDIGFFPLPDKDPAVRGVTKWLPAGFGITQEAKNVELAKEFLSYVLTDEAVDVYCSIQKPSGAFMIKGVSLPEGIYPALKEAQEWVDQASVPVMEYYSPIKGPNQAAICIQVASGTITAEEAVKQIEDDNRVFAEQLGLDGWTD